MIQKRKTVDSKSTISLKILPDDRIVKASQDATILEALLKAGIKVDASCEGSGTCGTCRFFIEKGLEQLEPRNGIESEFAQDRNFSENERLTCQCLAKDGLILRRP